MTEKATPEQFVGPLLSNGDRVAVQLPDGLLCNGVWLDGEFVGTIESGVISTKTRTAAPWRIHQHLIQTPRVWPWREPQWAICIQYVGHCEPVFHSDRAAVVFEAFAAGGAR
ncbi:hypothetical protein [Mycobacteroides abscessus]|uniref:hypothetical protein n=1 Tax=Mycobacteroides abscessus TaxID=36809 RepID=UPI0009A8ABE0|nr:hypothetical protein [Mycobacteroides abscessus]SLF39648.1 Uncharacterised protein [Mycobacteroides abscessus subsp. bolletii]